jgi:hypothetical protein
MKKFFYCIITAFLFIALFSSNNTNAQQIRKVLIEEGTNMGCGPCAARNPAFQRWISRNINHIIPVIYHASWPSPTDTIYCYNKDMSTTRISYYGISGVPTGVMAGQILPASNTSSFYDGAPNDTTALDKALAAQQFYTPIGINITMNQTNGTGTVHVSVTSSATMDTKKLRIVICEKYHHYNPGTNGETDFYYLARTMVPDNNGIDISLAANETKTFDYNFSVDTSFTGGLYAAAYIQDEVTKNILQAESTLDNPPPTKPNYAVFVNQFNFVFVGNPNTSLNLDVVLLNNSTEAVTFMMNAFKTSQTPSDWTATILDNKYVVSVEPNSTATLQLQFTIGATSSVGEANLNVQIQGKPITFETSKLVGISSDITTLHILAGEVEQSVQPIILKKLNDAGKPIEFDKDISSSNFAYALPMLNNIKTVIWDGSTTGAMNEQDATALQNAINSGIGVLICGGNINTGVTNYGVLSLFNASWVTYCQQGYGSSPWPVTLAGVHNDAISGDFGTDVSGHLIDWLLPIYKINDNSATTPVMTFKNNSDSIFAIKVQKTNSRAVLLGINPFVILDQTIRENLIYRSIQWIEGKINDDVTDATGNDFSAIVSPNPVIDRASLQLNGLTNNNSINVSIVNELGETVRQFNGNTIEALNQTMELDFTSFNAGAYFIMVKSGVKTVTISVVKM